MYFIDVCMIVLAFLFYQVCVKCQSFITKQREKKYFNQWKKHPILCGAYDVNIVDQSIYLYLHEMNY